MTFSSSFSFSSSLWKVEEVDSSLGSDRLEIGSDGLEIGSDGLEIGSDGLEIGSDGLEMGSDGFVLCTTAITLFGELDIASSSSSGSSSSSAGGPANLSLAKEKDESGVV